jgi:hypothetical protein
MKRTRPVYGLSLPKVGVGSRRSVQGVGQLYRNTWADVRNGDVTPMWISGLLRDLFQHTAKVPSAAPTSHPGAFA